MLSLKDFFVKHENRIVLFIGVILLSFISYGIGRLSVAQPKESVIIQASSQDILKNNPAVKEEVKQDEKNLTIKKQYGSINSQKIKEKNKIVKNTGLYVASKNGTKYHLPTCSGAKRIKEENKIWFDSKQEAEKAGYEPAKNCKGI